MSSPRPPRSERAREIVKQAIDIALQQMHGDMADSDWDITEDCLTAALVAFAQEVRDEALKEATAALWDRVDREEYGHAKAAVALDIEAVESLRSRAPGGGAETR